MSRAENAYWKKKLPPGFRYMLEKIGRGVCKGNPKPANVVEYIATYLEFKQSEHAAELAALPKVSYVQTLLAKKERKEASNIAAEQREGARTREETIQAASAAAIAAKESRVAESKKATDTRTSEDVLVKRPAPGGDDKRRSATKLPQAQKSVIEILYPNTSTGKIIADHKKGQVRGASHTSREEIRKETSKVTEIGRQRTSDQYLRETLKGSEQQLAESKSVIKTPSEPAVKSLSQPVLKVPSETFAPLLPNDKAPSQLVVKNPSTPAVKVPSQSVVKDQSDSFTPHTPIESAAGKEQEEQAGTSVVLIDSQKEVARVSHQQTAESLLATKSPSQPTVKDSSYTLASHTPIVKSSSQLVVKSPALAVLKVSSESTVKVPSHSVVSPAHVEPSADTEQEKPAKETVAQRDAPEVSLVSQQQIAEAIPASKLPSQVTIQFLSESFSQQVQIEKAPSQLVVQAPSQVIVKSPSQPAVNCPSRSAVKVSAYSVVSQAHIEPSKGGEQESPAEKAVVQTELDREVAHVSQEKIVESVITKKSPPKIVANVPSQQFVKVPSESLLTFQSQPAIRAPSELAVKTSQTAANVTSRSAVKVSAYSVVSQAHIEPSKGGEQESPAEKAVVQTELDREVAHASQEKIVESVITKKSPPKIVANVPSQQFVKVPSESLLTFQSQPAIRAPSELAVKTSQTAANVTSRSAVKVSAYSVVSQAHIEPSKGGEQESPAEKAVVQTELDREVAHASQEKIVESVITKKSPPKIVANVPSQQFVKVPSESLLTFQSQPAIRAPSELAVKTSQTAANVTSRSAVKVSAYSVVSQAHIEPSKGGEQESPAEKAVVQTELDREVAHASQEKIVESVITKKSPPKIVANVPSQQFVKVPSESLLTFQSQPAIRAPSELAVKTSQTAANVTSQPTTPKAGREFEEPAEERLVQAEAQSEVVQVSHKQIFDTITIIKAPSQPVIEAVSQQEIVKVPSLPSVKVPSHSVVSQQEIVKVPSLPSVKVPSHSVVSQQEIVKVPSLPSVKVPSHSVVKVPSQPSVKAPSQLIVNLSQPDLKVTSESVASHPAIESAEDRKLEEPVKQIVIETEVQKEIAPVSQQQIAESISTVKTPSQPVVKAKSQQVIHVPLQPAVKTSSQQIVKDSHSVDKAPSQQAVKASSQTAVKETVVAAEFQRNVGNVAQVSQQQIAESTAKTQSQKVQSQSVVKSPSRPAVKASSQQIVKVASHSVVKAPSQPTVKAPSQSTVRAPSQPALKTSQPAVKTSQPAVKISSQRIATRAPIEPTSNRELEKPAKETVLLVDNHREFSQVSQQQIVEAIPATKAPSQPAVKTISQPIVKSTSRPSVKAASQHIVKGPSLSTVKVPSHSVVKAPSQPTVKAPSQPTVKAPSQPTVKVPSKLVQSAAGREMDEQCKETVAPIEIQMEITQVSQQQIAESVSDGNVHARSQPAIEVPSQSAVKISSQLIASLEPMELATGKIQVESADKTIVETEDSLRMDIPGQPIEETTPLEETEVESVRKTEEFVQSPLDQPVIISTQDPVTVAESPANELNTESELVKLTEQTLAETVENVRIPEVIQTGDEGKVFGVEIDLTFEAETVSSLVAIKAEAEEEKEKPLHIEVDREERKELINCGDVPAHEHLDFIFGDLADETRISVLQELAEGTGQEASLQKTKASVSHLSFEEACASVQEAKSNEPYISPALVPTEDTDTPVHAYDTTSEVHASHIAAEEDSVSLHAATFKEPEDSSHLSSGEAYGLLEGDRANESAKQPQITEAFVEQPETASLESSAEKCKEELSEISKVVVCHKSLSIELNAIEADIQEVSETYNADVCQRRLSIDPTITDVEEQVEVSETSKVAVLPRRLSIDQTVTEVEGGVEVSETAKDSVCQERLPLDADAQEVLTETCETAVCQKMISITEAEADVSKDPCNTALCQRKLSLESTNTETETQAEVSEMSSKEPGLQALCTPTEELATPAEISETPGNEPNVPIEESECYVSNVPAENVQGYIHNTFPEESELLSSHASLEESISTAPVLEASSQEHESLSSNVPSEELQMPVLKTCSNEPEACPPSEEPIAPALEVPSEEPQVFSHTSEYSANEVKDPIHSV